ncbi:unnamed protein product [Auanema sp. JU1783]|nr:unnamed protein product [Auanema sp. JU1783]
MENAPSNSSFDLRAVLEFGLHVLENVEPPMIDGDHPSNATAFSKANVSLAPIGILRGWALLALAASGKTRSTLEKGLRKVLQSREDIHDVLYSIADTSNEIIRLYGDFPRDSIPVRSLMEKMKQYYGEKPGVNPLRRMCFNCDHDGMRSIYEINHDFAVSSANRLRYVVREEDAPCRRAITALVSASDYTFYWKHNGSPIEPRLHYFYSSTEKKTKGRSVVHAWTIRDEFRTMAIDNLTAVQLDSFSNTKFLYLIKSSNSSAPTADQLLHILKKLPKEGKTNTSICFPRFTVATPIQLRECFREKGSYGFNRVFDREKSVLTGFLTHFHPYYPTLTTLWDFYHKSLITIVDGQDSVSATAQPLRLQVGFESRLRYELSPWNFNTGIVDALLKLIMTSIHIDYAAQCKKYHEERLPGYIDSSCPAEGIVFDHPFYFMIVEYGSSTPSVQCLGFFVRLKALAIVLNFAKQNCRTTITQWSPRSPGDILAKSFTDAFYSSIRPSITLVENILLTKVPEMFNIGQNDFLTAARLASLEDDAMLCSQAETPEWVSGPRDFASLHKIIETASSSEKGAAAFFSEYAFGEILKIIERLEPIEEDHFSALETAYESIFFWLDRIGYDEAQPGMILDAIPFLIERSCKHERFKYAITILKDFLRLCLQRSDPVLCRIISQDEIKDKKWIYDNFIWRYSRLLTQQILHVRKVAISIIGHVSRMFGTRFTDMFSVPHLLALCDDSNWGVRKTVCENFVEVSKYCRRQTREKVLAPKFITLLRDPSRWVCFAAFQELGPFISTFANPHVTGMKLMDGKVLVCGEERDISEIPENLWDSPISDKTFSYLPPGALLPNDILDDQMSSDETPSPTDNLTRVVDGLQDMMDAWATSSSRKYAHDAPTLNKKSDPCSSIAAKCNSVEDLSNIGLDDGTVVDMSMDSDEEGDVETIQAMDITVIDYDDRRMNKSSEDDLNSSNSSTHSQDNYNQLMYWSNDVDDIDIDLELQPFGASSDEDKSVSYLDRRFDILAIHTKSSDSFKKETKNDSLLHSPKQSTFSFESDDQDMEIFKDVRGTDEDDDDEDVMDDENEEKDSVHTRRLVPKALIESYMSMTSTSGTNEGDINRYCAHNFPAVAFTLGRSSWSQIRSTYVQLAGDDQLRVRLSIASSLHEMAVIIGSSKTESDLLPIFNSLRSDLPEVRVGVLKNLFQFVKCLSPKSQLKMVEILPSFMPIDNNAMNSNWRYRLEFALQCQQLCDIYSLEDINRTMTAIALTLANDRVAEVRLEAVELVSIVLARILKGEWNNMESAEESTDNKPLAPLSERLVQDIVSGFAKTQKWTRRQTFVNLCERCLRRNAMDEEQFRYFFLPHVSAMAFDKVANVRLGVCRVLGLLNPELKPAPLGNEQTLSVKEILNRLVGDSDMDVSREARIAMRLPPLTDYIDVRDRHKRLQEREDAMIVSHTMEKDNYSHCDMSISPQKDLV